MIGTLIAQERLSTSKRLLVSVGILLLIATVSLATAALRVPLLGGLGLGIGIIAVILVTPVALALLAENYWRTMYGQQGYFTMTIPVRGRELFTAKVLYALIVSMIALAITGAGLIGASAAVSISQGQPAFSVLRATIDTLQAPMVWFLGGAFVLQLVFTVIAGAAIMSIGAEGRYNSLGFGAPVIGGVIAYFAMQILGLISMLFVPLGIRLTGPDAGTFVAQGMLDDFMASLRQSETSAEVSTLGLGIVFVSVLGAVLLAWWGGRSVERHTSLR